MTERGGFNARGDWPDEAVAASVRSFDETWGPGIVGKRFADLADRHFQDRVADKCILPDGTNQMLLGHELACPREQEFEYRERFRPQFDGARVVPEALVHQIEGERREVNTTFVRHHITARNRIFTATL